MGPGKGMDRTGTGERGATGAKDHLNPWYTTP